MRWRICRGQGRRGLWRGRCRSCAVCLGREGSDWFERLVEGGIDKGGKLTPSDSLTGSACGAWWASPAWSELLLLLSYRRGGTRVLRRARRSRFRRVCSMVGVG